MAFLGGCAVAAAIAAEEEMVAVHCKHCRKEIRVLASGEGPNTCVGCGLDFCDDCGISFMCNQCLHKVPEDVKGVMRYKREEVNRLSSMFWVFIIAIVIEALIGLLPLILGNHGLDQLGFVLVFAIVGPIFTAAIPMVIIKLKEERIRNETIDIARAHRNKI